MTDKPYHKMTDDELREAHLKWTANVANAAGWPSAYFAAGQLEIICREGDRRSMGLKNGYPIIRS